MPPKPKGQNIALVPYGQGTPTAEQVAHAVKNVSAWRKKPTEYNLKFPSFALWCQMFGYDEDAGMDLFNKTCNFLLCQNASRAKKTAPDLSTSYISRKDFTVVQPATNNPREPVEYVGHQVGTFHVPGAEIGKMTGDTAVIVGGYMDFIKGGAAPGSKLNWLRAINLTHHANVGDTADQFTSQGVTPAENSTAHTEVHGTVQSLGNTLATVAGLYYYPDCRNPKYNWTVKQVVDGREYLIRMRHPNPSYIFFIDGKVEYRVNEEKLKGHSHPHTFNNQTPNNTHLYPFPVPILFHHEKKGGHLPHIMFCHPSDGQLKPQITPSISPLPQIGTKFRDLLHANHRLAKQLGGLLHTPESDANGQGPAFGVRVAKAHWLYPHYYHPSEVQAGTGAAPFLHGFIADPKYKADKLANLKSGENEHRFKDLRVDFFDEPLLTTDAALLRGATDLSVYDEIRREVLGVGSVVGQVASTDPVPIQVVVGGGEQDDGLNPPVPNPRASRAAPAPRLQGDVDAAEEAELRRLEGAQNVVPPGPDNGEERVETRTAFHVETEFEIATEGDLLLHSGYGTKANEAYEGKKAVKKKREKLTPGDPKREHDRNCHFRFFVPWKHEYLYEQSEQTFVPTPMSEEEAKRHAATYGNNNAYNKGGGPTEILYNNIKSVLGEPRETSNGGLMLDTLITDFHLTDGGRKEHRKSMYGILMIYFDKCDMGNTMTRVVRHTTKQAGMLQGMGLVSNDKGQEVLTPMGAGAVFPPVFRHAPPANWKSIFSIDFCDMPAAQQEKAMRRMDDVDLSVLKSDMTVYDWVCSPYHYEYLPYQPQQAGFKDGETFSRGCNRCSRLFYEYKTHRAWMNGLSNPKTKHWPRMLIGEEALPFHDDSFFEPAGRKKLGWDVDKYVGPGWGGGDHVSKAARDTLLFRRYANEAYTEERRMKPQSRLTSYSHTKVPTGKEFRLTRVGRFSNCCTDCAALLEACSLFDRSYTLIYQDGIVKGNKRAMKWSPIWQNLIGKVNDGTGERFTEEDLFVAKDRPSVVTQAQMDKNLLVVSKYLRETFHDVPERPTKLTMPPDIHVQHKRGDDEGLSVLQKIERSGNGVTLSKAEVDKIRSIVADSRSKYEHLQKKGPRESNDIDIDHFRQEFRNVTHNGFRNCLHIVEQKQNGDVVETMHEATREGRGGDQIRKGRKLGRRAGEQWEQKRDGTMWEGDGHVTVPGRDWWVDRPGVDKKQYRKMRQSNFFITYSLHRPIENEGEGRYNMERMADALRDVFGDDRVLAQFIRFGQKLVLGATDTIGPAHWQIIYEPRKKEDLKWFYADQSTSSYIYDTYETHIDSVGVDGGVELGPIRKHLHFHLLLSVKHWSYIHIDYFRMNAILEMMFKGIDPYNLFPGVDVRKKYMLVDNSGLRYYGDNESPWVDVTLYPQDNWKDVLAAYVRKNATPSIFEALQKRV